MKQVELKNEWSKRIAEFKKSGEKNQSAWCRKNGISIKTFGRWYRSLEKENVATMSETKSDISTGIFLPVITKSDRVSAPIHIKIGRITLEVNENITPEHLTEVLKVVTILC